MSAYPRTWGHSRGCSGTSAQCHMGHPQDGPPQPLNWSRPRARVGGLWPCWLVHVVTGRWPRMVGHSCPVTPPGAILGFTPSRAPKQAPGKEGPAGTPGTRTIPMCQVLPGLGRPWRGLLAWPWLVTLGTACELTCSSRAVTLLSSRLHQGHVSPGDTEAPRLHQASPMRGQIQGHS